MTTSISEQLKRGKISEWKHMLLVLFLIVAIVLPVYADIDSSISLPVIFTAAAAMLICVPSFRRLEGKACRKIGDNLLTELLENQLPGMSMLSQASIANVSPQLMGFTISYSGIHHWAHLTGDYKGHHCEISAIRFYLKVNRPYSIIPVFQGPWIWMAGRHKPQSDLNLVSRTTISRKLQTQAVPTGTQDFDDAFAAIPQCKEDMNALLTPERQQLIVKLKEQARGDIFLKFSPDGTLCLAVNNKREMLGISSFNHTEDELRKCYAKDFNLLRNLLDTMAQLAG